MPALSVQGNFNPIGILIVNSQEWLHIKHDSWSEFDSNGHIQLFARKESPGLEHKNYSYVFSKLFCPLISLSTHYI